MTSAFRVSDHALVRYLERVRGEDVDGLRREIETLPGLQEAFAAGAAWHVDAAGWLYVFAEDTLVTIWRAGGSP